MKYLTEVKYNPKYDGVLEKFLGNLNYIFTQLSTAGNEFNDVSKLGIIRSALEKGSNKYNDILRMTKF